jgi:hypothetical protein
VGSAMPSQSEKYQDYARECVRLAGHADSPETRDRLLDLARVWMDAAMSEDEAMAAKPEALPSRSHPGREPAPSG